MPVSFRQSEITLFLCRKMSNKAKESIDSMLAAGVAPRDTRGGAVILKTGARYHALVTTAGDKTKLGTYWEEKTSEELPVGGFDPTQSPFRQGDVEYIRMRSGQERAVRRYSPVDNEYKFTALGKSFYSRLKRSYVVQIPVTIKGRRKNGTHYNVKSTMPVSKMGLDQITIPLNLTPAQRDSKIKEIVKRQLNLAEPLYEVSQEKWKYDAASEGAWVINEETVARDPDNGEMVVALDRRTGTAPYSLSQLSYSEDLCEEAFIDIDDMLCVARQISPLLNLDFGLVCNELTELERKLYGVEFGQRRKLLLEW